MPTLQQSPHPHSPPPAIPQTQSPPESHTPQATILLENLSPVVTAMAQELFSVVSDEDIETTQRTMKLLYRKIAALTEGAE